MPRKPCQPYLLPRAINTKNQQYQLIVGMIKMHNLVIGLNLVQKRKLDNLSGITNEKLF